MPSHQNRAQNTSQQIQTYGRQIAKFIIPMLKNQTVNTNQQRLLLTKLLPSPHDTPLEVDFRPPHKHLQGPSLPPHQFESQLPHFNHDLLHYTPAFILPLDKKFYAENIHFEKLKFQERIQNAQEKHIPDNPHQIAPPNTYCQVCRITYDDYQRHTNSTTHLLMSANSPANQLIRDLTLRFVTNPVKSKKIAKPQSKESKANPLKRQGPPRRNCTKLKPLQTFSKTTSLSTNMLSEAI